MGLDVLHLGQATHQSRARRDAERGGRLEFEPDNAVTPSFCQIQHFSDHFVLASPLVGGQLARLDVCPFFSATSDVPLTLFQLRILAHVRQRRLQLRRPLLPKVSHQRSPRRRQLTRWPGVFLMQSTSRTPLQRAVVEPTSTRFWHSLRPFARFVHFPRMKRDRQLSDR